MFLSAGGNGGSKNPSRPRYRSPRSVQRHRRESSAENNTQQKTWWTLKMGLLCVALFLMMWALFVPAILLEYGGVIETDTAQQEHGLNALLHNSHFIKNNWDKFSDGTTTASNKRGGVLKNFFSPNLVPQQQHDDAPADDGDDTLDKIDESLARGVSGLPASQTPALIGAKRGTIQCDENIDDLAYWNHPQGIRDNEFKSPFSSEKEKFLTFEADLGGWNNIRMSMESIFVMALAMGRTLVLPPKAPFYLLGMGAKGAKSFGNFFPLDRLEKRLKIITMKEFVQQHGERFLHLTEAQVNDILPTADMCIYREDDQRYCEPLWRLLRTNGIQPEMEASKSCFVFDEPSFRGKSVSMDAERRVDRFCGKNRSPFYYDQAMHDTEWIHWDAGHHEHRILNHFYSFIYFTDPVADNYYKRFVRDFLHYTDEIYCAAGKIVHALQQETSDSSFSTLHVRRGDFQFKETRLSAEEWYNNTQQVWKPNELLYIATDERNKTWFQPFAEHHKLKFLDDFFDMANLGKLDSSYLGMIDTIIASHGRAFAGTWFSSFTGYINRLRGYNGFSMKDSWFAYLPRQSRMHTWTYPWGNYPAREFPIGWVAIDGDTVIEHEREDGSPPTPKPQASKKKKLRNNKKRHVDVPSLAELKQDDTFRDERPLSRGVAGLPMSQTPALEGGSRAHIQCDLNVDSLAYWNDPQGHRDLEFESPFSVEGATKYITFTPDTGGWNNIRMSMEIIFMFAAVSGRTLVLPPEMNLYLLNNDKHKRGRGFADFFPLHANEFQKRVTVITMEEFVRREGTNGQLAIPKESINNVTKASVHCVNRKKDANYCGHLSTYLSSVGYLPEFRAKDYCVVFDKDVYSNNPIKPENEDAARQFCGTRKIAYWDREFRDPPLVHFRAGEKQWRLLTHYYGMLFFTDPAVGNYFHRFVRDFLHYHDAIYCAAGKIVKALQVEGIKRGFTLDQEGGGGYSAMHIRRGDFQYKKVKLPAEEWYENTKEIWQSNEILFIATDERNKTWFDPIAKHHTLRFLDDYWDLAKLGDLDPNYMGMIDTIVASRGRAFAGTWFSTFSGYINRMRGYHGMTMKDSWYSFLERKTAVHTWKNDSKYAYAYEWPTGWVGIDGDAVPSRDKF